MLYPDSASYSQKHAKSSFHGICAIPIQANEAGQIIAISFALNNTIIKIAGAFNTRRNMCFMKKSSATNKALMA
jgi:hypothetical protein